MAAISGRKPRGRAWCGRRDLNPHDFRHWNLNPARLPIPPRPLWAALDASRTAERRGLYQAGRQAARKKAARRVRPVFEYKGRPLTPESVRAPSPARRSARSQRLQDLAPAPMDQNLSPDAVTLTKT